MTPPQWDESFEAPWYGLPEGSGTCTVMPVVNAWLKLDSKEIMTPQDEPFMQGLLAALASANDTDRRHESVVCLVSPT